MSIRKDISPTNSVSKNQYYRSDYMQDSTPGQEHQAHRTISMSPINIPAHLIERACLISVSANKEWIAYIAYSQISSKERCFILKVHKLRDPEPTMVTGIDLLQEESTKHLMHDFENAVCFLSVSSNGEHVVLSYFSIDGEEDLRERQQISFIFSTVNNVVLEKKLSCRGRPIFLQNNFLIFVDEKKVEVYDCPNHFKLVKWLDISPLMSNRYAYRIGESHQFKDEYLLSKTPSISYSYPLNVAQSLENILRITKLAQDGVLVTNYNQQGSRIWCLDTGLRLTSFKSSADLKYRHSVDTKNNLDILSVASDKKYAATFVSASCSINVYHMKTGLLVYRLQSKFGEKEKRLLDCNSNVKHPKAVSFNYARFCSANQYLFHIFVYNGQASKMAMIFFEVWDIKAEKSILQETDLILVDWQEKNSFIEPFVLESGSYQDGRKFTAIYTTLLENKSCQVRTMDLKVHGRENFGDWHVKQVCNSTSYFIKYEISDDEDIFANMTCLAYYNEGNANIEYLLCFGSFTVQLWRISTYIVDDKESKKNELIYIRGFKSHCYHYSNAFFEQWKRIGSSNNADFVNIATANQNNCSKSVTEETLLNLGLEYVDLEVEGRVTVSINSFYGIMDPCPPRFYQDEIYLPLLDLQEAEKSSDFKFACIDYHYVESVCQALHTIYNRYENIECTIYKKTKQLIVTAIEKLQEGKSKYFTTVSGSNVLAMLASFPDGRDILFRILQAKNLEISLFSYVFEGASTEIFGETINRYTNALTILIDESEYDLYYLLLSKALLCSANLGIGSFSAISDTLVFLQGRGDTDVFRYSCQKLQYLRIDKRLVSNLSGEVDETMSVDTLRKDLEMDYSEVSSNTTNEQIVQYNNNWFGHIFYVRALYWNHLQDIILLYKRNSKLQRVIRRYTRRPRASQELVLLCAVPFIYFSSYSIFQEDIESDLAHENREDHSLWWKLKKSINLNSDQKGLVYKAKSDFLRLALKQHKNDLFHQEGTVLEVLLYYRWKTFFRRRFFWICSVHVLYYVSFSLGVLFSKETFGYIPGCSVDNYKHIAVLSVMFLSNGVLFYQEIKQFILSHNKLKESLTLYNILDDCALILPIINFWQMLDGKLGLEKLGAITTITLWLHGILRLRAIAFIGITLETLIQLMKTVYKILFIMLLVIFAFTNAFIVLLSHKNESYFQEKYSGSIDLSNSGLAAENSLEQSDDSSSNNFKTPFKAFSTLWFFIYGVWDPITDGDAGDDTVIIIFAILFSFVTVLLFFNLVIALMSSRAEEIRALGKSVWLSHFAAVIAEIEQLWCSRFERTYHKHSPSHVYYMAKKTDVQRQTEIIENDIDGLVKTLQSKLEK